MRKNIHLVFEAKTVTFIISLRISFLFFTIKAKTNLHGHCGYVSYLKGTDF